MKKIIMLILITFSFGFNFEKQDTTIISTTKQTATINKNIEKGLTGYVIHNNMMIAKAISLGNNNVKYQPLTSLKNPALATPKILPQKNDHIIFGLYNFRGLIIAPNQTSYLKIKDKYPNVNFISSDIFANYFDNVPEKKDFQRFCTNFNIGFIDFILDKEYIIDCNSFVILDKKEIQPIKYTKPFFTNYDKFNKSMFSDIPDNWINYYKAMLKK